MFLAITAIGAAGLVAPFALPARNAKGSGASASSLVLAGVAAVIGFFIIPVIGFAALGIPAMYLGERLRNQPHDAAITATVSTIKGLGWAIAIQFTAGLAMIVFWLLWVALG